LPSWHEANLWEQQRQRGYPDAGRTCQLVNRAVQHPVAARTASDFPFSDEQPDKVFQRHVLQHPMRESVPPPVHSADLTTPLARTETSPSIEQASRPAAQGNEFEMVAAQATEAITVPNWDPFTPAGIGKGGPASPDWGSNAPVAPGWDAKGRGKGNLMEANRNEVQQSHSQQGIAQRKYEWKSYTEGALPRMEEDFLWEQAPPRQHRDSRDVASGSQMLWNHERRQSHFGEDISQFAGVSTPPEPESLNVFRQHLAALAAQKDLSRQGTASGSNKSLGMVATDGDLPSFRQASGSKVLTDGDLPSFQWVSGSKAEKRVSFEPRFRKGVSGSQQSRAPPGLEMPPGLGGGAGHA